MNKKFFAVSLMSLLIATACSQKEEQKTEKKSTAAVSSCRNPAVPAQLQQDLESAIMSETQNYIKEDSHQFIDPDKMTAAASQLKLTINGIQDKDGQCRGKLSIVIPQNVQKVASAHALLVGIKHYDTIIEERMGSANFQFNGSTLTLPINFTVEGEPISVKQSDEAFQTAAAALTTALLPYSVKEHVNVAGRTMTREMALQAVKLNGGKIPVAPAQKTELSQEQTQTTQPKPTQTENPTPKPKPKPETPAKPVESAEQKALREARVAEAAAKAEAEKAAERAAKAKAAREAAEAAKLKEAAERAAKAKAQAVQQAAQTPDNTKKTDTSISSLTPNRKNNTNNNNNDETKTATNTDTPKKARVSNEELEKVRKAHSQADQEIKSSWKKITPEIQKELVEEQKAWERQRTQRCRQAAAAGADESESNKLYMQCDTRMTKERVKNLEGYSIP